MGVKDQFTSFVPLRLVATLIPRATFACGRRIVVEQNFVIAVVVKVLYARSEFALHFPS